MRRRRLIGRMPVALGLLWLGGRRAGLLAVPGVAAQPSEGGTPDDEGFWQPISALGAPLARWRPLAVWTGQEMAVWGGYTWDQAHKPTPVVPLQDGALYDPSSDTWRPMSAVGAPARAGTDQAPAFWAGQEMLVWLGATGQAVLYDPVADAWNPRALAPGLVPRDWNSVVWTGDELLVWDGTAAAPGGRYDLASDSWRRMSAAAAPEVRLNNAVVWTGSEMLVWGGQWVSGTANGYLANGGRYDPASDTWRPLAEEGAPSPRESPAAVWTGTEMLIWGGIDGGEGAVPAIFADGGAYDPATDTWRPIATATTLGPRVAAEAIWTGMEMIVAGSNFPPGSSSFGARYAPSTDVWTVLPDQGAPSPRANQALVWTGTEMLIWGGLGDVVRGDGARYTPPQPAPGPPALTTTDGSTK